MNRKRVDVVYALLYDEQTQKILMVLNKNQTWSLPGGTVEKGETLPEATKREVMEETGNDIQVGNMIAFNEAFIDENHVYFITFHGKIIKRPEKLPNDPSILQVEWKSVEEAGRLMPYLPNGISSMLHESGIHYTLQN